MALTRISITIPRDLLRAADARAKAEDRPRSWVVVEALRAFLERSAPASRVSESAAPAYGAGEVAAAREARLASDLRLSPAERLARAAEIVALSRLVHPRHPRRQVIGFDSYEDFYEWKRKERLGGA
jgi:predicted transcriptional regulator